MNNEYSLTAYERLSHVRSIMNGLCGTYDDDMDAGHCEALRDIINCANHLLKCAAENEARAKKDIAA